VGKITKAIIPVAGYGTRMLPITKAIEKAMLPVGGRPIVDYSVQDCIESGIKDIYFVVAKGSTQIKDYYSHNKDLEKYLRANKKKDSLALVKPPKGINFHYIYQDTNGKYGTAIPVALALEKTGVDEPVVVLMGDDFIYNHNGVSNVSQMIASCTGGNAVMLGALINKKEVEKYGVINTDAQNNFLEIVEKPTPEEAPSNMINVSKYILPPELLKSIRSFAKRKNSGGEYYITDPINAFVENGGVMKVVPALGQYLDGGNLEGWLRANEVVGKDLLK
jgi:UTP--glucose-1-phosphate uridylyltransferase